MSLPYFRMYPTDYEADTAHLTTEEDGAYNRLLRLCWRTPGCSLPSDHDWIRRRVRASVEEYDRAYRPVLAEFFKTENQRVYNRRLFTEFSDASRRCEIASENGRKGGRPAKTLKTNETEKATGSRPVSGKKANQNQNQIKKEDTNVSSKKTPRRKPQVPLPELWRASPHAVLSEKNRKAALEAGMTAETAGHETHQFVDHHTGKDSRNADWDGCWRTWCRNWVKFGSKQFRRGGSPRGTQSGRHDGGSGSIASYLAQRDSRRADDSEWSGGIDSGGGGQDTELRGGGGCGDVVVDARASFTNRALVG